MNTFTFYYCVFVLLCVYKEISAVYPYVGPVSCFFQQDCKYLENATCENDFCECNGSKICKELPNKVVMKIGLRCEKQSECNIENSECRNFKCLCQSGYTYNNDGTRCLKIAEGLGSECENSVQCYVKMANSGCHDGKCICLQHSHEYNRTCYHNKELGEKCTHNGDCSNTHFAECINSKCSCIDKYVTVPSADTPICLPLAEKYNASCIHDEQCTASLGIGSGCFSSFCQCKEIYQFKESTKKCVRDMMLNDNCGTHSDCRDPFEKESRLECIMGVCKCKSFYKEIEGHCINAGRHYKAVSTTLVLLFVIFLSINFL